jgi:hypothetical protein
MRIARVVLRVLLGLPPLSLVAAACDLGAGDPKLPPAAQTVRERHGEDPDRDLSLQAQGAVAVSEAAWSASGYEQKQFGWRLPFEDAAKRRIASGPWRLDNWTENPAGRFEAKRGPHYFGTFEVDDDGDGKIEGWERHEEALFDVKLVNEEDDSVVWIKTRAIEPGTAKRKLELVARDYIDALSGEATLAQLDLFGQERERTRRLTTLVKSIRETRVGGHRALEAVADIADADDLRVDRRARLGQLRVLVARVGYFVARRSPVERSAWPSVEHHGATVWQKTAIFVIGSLSGVGDVGSASLVGDLAARVTFTDASTVVEVPRPATPAPTNVPGASAI